ncbi:uncharacterized protein LOC143275438 [Babylonia areolata]|uniref:uncharacterized protein LOC143275438 n=1 Tax=Babylonia areolata TaxID=304850 RepID=UPI003FD208FE
MVRKVSSLAVFWVSVAIILGCVCLDIVSSKALRQMATQLEWYDPMENATEGDYLAMTAGMAALNPPPGWDASAQGYRPGRATNTHSCNHIRSVPSQLRSSRYMKPRGLSNFYQKYTEAYGIPVVASHRVSDNAMKRACYITRFLFADHSRVRQSYYARSGRVAVIGENERTTDIPEHSWLGPGWNQRARGLGATDSAPVSTCGEENILCLRSDRWHDEDIMIHELAHGVHLLGAKYAISGWQRRLESLYRSAKYSGKWANTYAMSTQDEYFAEGTQSFFDCNPYYPRPNGIHNSINTQSKLRSYDPALFRLVYDVFPCNNTYMLRCKHSREAELRQQLRINCDLDGGGVTSGPATTTTGGGGGGVATTTRPLPTTTASPQGCRDKNSFCPSWARYGYCQSNRSYMSTNCRRSCNLCGGRGSNCRDRSNHCGYWARNGECGRNPGYMHQSCKRSCNRC